MRLWHGTWPSTAQWDDQDDNAPEVTSNLTMAGDPACLFIDTTTPDGRATGVARDCVVSCLVLVTIYADTIAQALGTLPPAQKQRLDNCLKAAMALP